MDKIICVGKNYAEHAKELGDAVCDRPVVFLKPPSVLKAASRDGEEIPLVLPTGSGSVHHECEIVLQLARGGYRLSLDDARDAIGAVTLGLDMTLRDLQAQQKKAGHPWTTSKVFPDSAVVGPFREGTRLLGEPFRLLVDGELRQEGHADQMLYGPAQCVAFLSELFYLLPGDLIFTGTPKGVGPVSAGNRGELIWGDLRYAVRWSL